MWGGAEKERVPEPSGFGASESKLGVQGESAANAATKPVLDRRDGSRESVVDCGSAPGELPGGGALRAVP